MLTPFLFDGKGEQYVEKRSNEKENKIIKVKKGFLEFDSEAYLSGADKFLKVFQEEATKCIHKSELIDWAPVKYEESLRKVTVAFDKLLGQ